jgi:hypothetical protein
MDREMLHRHLKMATGHAEEGERHIARQKVILADFEFAGRDTTEAKRLLINFEESQDLHLAHIERILVALDKPD